MKSLHNFKSQLEACDFKFATLKWFTPVPGLGPELCHDRGLALPRPWDCVGVTVALGVSSVVVVQWLRDWHLAGVREHSFGRYCRQPTPE